jgi:pre-rRNA-processing protein RIX1
MMAQSSLTRSIGTLRAITYRLTSTPTQQLPLLASQLSATIGNCKDILSTPADNLKVNPEAATLAHRFKTSLTSLLQDRTIEGRWAAVVLVKAVIESGGLEVLGKSNAWVKSLLAILKKPDPSTTKCLTILTLTRIFTLTWDHSNLVREITTPALPGFISTCLVNAAKHRCSAVELETILEAFVRLVPRHPTIFRTHETQIRLLVSKILCSESPSYSECQKDAAARLSVLLHHCAPKQGSSEQWDKTFQAAITAAHTACDRLFRSIEEEWQSTPGVHKSTDSTLISSTEAQFEGEDALGLGNWHGVLGGRERLLTIIHLLKSYLGLATTSSTPIRLGLLIDLLTRLFSLATPTATDSVQSNPQISRDEREALFAILPSTHVASIELIETLLERFKHASASFVQSLLELLLPVYNAERFDNELRLKMYTCLDQMLQLFGPSMPKQTVLGFNPILKESCEDLLPSMSTPSQQNGTLLPTQPPASVLSSSKCTTVQAAAASRLLTTSLMSITPGHIPLKLRTQIERTAILTRNKDMLVACVMNPARKDVSGKLQTSLLPLLAREFRDAKEVEAIVRPRMPVVPTGNFESSGEDYMEEEDEEMIEEEQVNGLDAHTPEERGLNSTVNPLLQNTSSGATRNEDEDLYTVTPPNEPITGAKRPAGELSPSDETSAKRLRGSEVAETLAPEETALPGADPASINAALPVTVSVPSGDGEESRVVVEQMQEPPQGSTSQQPAGGLVDDDSDSDFEIPPLTFAPEMDLQDEDED